MAFSGRCPRRHSAWGIDEFFNSHAYFLVPLLCSYSWLDNETIVACVIPEGHGPAPQKPGMPLGPKIQVWRYGASSCVDVPLPYHALL